MYAVGRTVNLSNVVDDESFRRFSSTTSVWQSTFLLTLWNTLILTSAFAEIVGYTVLPTIIERSYGCYHIPEQHQNIGMKLRRLITGALLHSVHTATATSSDIWNCTIPVSTSYSNTLPKIFENRYIHHQKSYEIQDFTSCCGIIHKYRVRSSAFFSILCCIQSFVVAIQLAKSRKLKLDEIRSWAVSTWHESNDDVVITLKKWIINFILLLFDKPSSYTVPLLEVLDLLDIIFTTFLYFLFHLSLLPQNFWAHVKDAVGTLPLPSVVSHPILEMKVRYYSFFIKEYIQKLSAQYIRELKGLTVQLAIMHPKDFYYYLRLINNSQSVVKYMLPAMDALLSELEARNSLRKANEEFKKAEMAIEVLNLIIERKEDRLTKAVRVLQRKYHSKKKRNSTNKKTSRRTSRSLAIFHQKSDISSCSSTAWDENYERWQVIKQEVHSLNTNSPGTFLLRPTTKAAILWRRLILVCTTIELLHNMLEPMLLQSDMATVSEKCPHRLRFWRVLNKNPPKLPSTAKGLKDWNILHNYTLRRTKGDQCPNASFWQRLRSFANVWFVSRFSCVAATVRFIHCFVNVFEGTYDLEGILVPKPFIGKPVFDCSLCSAVHSSIPHINFLQLLYIPERWIFPGFVFEMMLNPLMSFILEFLKRFVRFIFHIGLSRVIRWLFVLSKTFAYFGGSLVT